MSFNSLLAVFLSFLGLLLPALAQVPYNPSQFNIIGAITGMTLNKPTAGRTPLTGGTITVNGIPMIVPDNTIATLPSIAVAWPELFDVNDVPQLPGTQSWVANIVGNRVGDSYIAGLVYISQNPSLFLQGFITSINPTTGHFTVGGAFPGGGIDCVINDPTGTYAAAYTGNPLWSVDPSNPSIHSPSGFPMCIPRVAAPAVDPYCPLKNRPTDSATGKPTLALQFKAPTAVTATDPDPFTMVPLVVGDYVTFSGQQVGNVFEVNNLEANVGIFTAPNTLPAYIVVESVQIALINPTAAAGPFAIGETKAVAFTTDPFATLNWYAQDVNPCTGAITERLITTLQAENAAPPLGRAVFRLGKIAMDPPTRNVVFRLTTGTVPTNTVSNITAGQYVQPVFNFNFPEITVPGSPQVANAFDTMPFLSQGSGPYVPGNPLAKPLASPINIGQLNPWPGATTPTIAACPTPTTTLASVSPTATTVPETIVINSAVQSKARQGSFQVVVTATTNKSTNLFLTVAGSNPVPNPLTNAPMTSLGNGKWTLTAQIKAAPLSVVVTSDGTPSGSSPVTPV